jgi:hypothetical protein
MEVCRVILASFPLVTKAWLISPIEPGRRSIAVPQPIQVVMPTGLQALPRTMAAFTGKSQAGFLLVQAGSAAQDAPPAKDLQKQIRTAERVRGERLRMSRTYRVRKAPLCRSRVSANDPHGCGKCHQSLGAIAVAGFGGSEQVQDGLVQTFPCYMPRNFHSPRFHSPRPRGPT